MTQSELTLHYNALANKLGLPIIGLWKKSKAIIEDRIAGMELQVEKNRIKALSEAKKIIAPKKVQEIKGATPDISKVSPEFVKHLSLLMGSVSTAKAFRQTMAMFPDTSRIVAKHSGAAAGMKPKTARNLFDLINKEKSCS